MSKTVDLGRLADRLKTEPSIRFALVFGSGRDGSLPTNRSDLDVALYLDRPPDLDERLRLMGLIQDTVGFDEVDVVFLNAAEDLILRRETLKGRLLFCRDRDVYQEFFSLADRQGRDEEARIQRAWALRKELSVPSPSPLPRRGGEG